MEDWKRNFKEKAKKLNKMCTVVGNNKACGDSKPRWFFALISACWSVNLKYLKYWDSHLAPLNQVSPALLESLFLLLTS